MNYITNWWEDKLPTLEQIKLGTLTFDVKCILLQPNGYKIILGRCNGKPRIWYRSKSESCWRAFTGFRANGAWQKGDENGPDYRGSGYVFECMVAPKLDEKFDEIFTKNKAINIKILVRDVYIARHSSQIKWDKYNLAEYLMAPNHYGRPGIAQEYAAERKFSRPLKDANVLPIPKSGHKNFSTVGSVDIQMGYKGKLLNMSYLQNYHNVYGDALRAVLISQRKSHHDVLNQDIDIDTYQFEYNGKMYCYEIAKTLNEVPHYFTKNNQQLNVDARIVWVRMLYQLDNNEVSSFGNYLVIPIEMAGLVQKPCDYDSQVADIYKIEIQQQGALGAYALLSVMNEVASPIIQQYKLINNELLLSGNNEPMLDGVKFTYTTPPPFKLLQLNRPFLLSGANMFKPPVIQQPVIQQPVIQQPVNINLGNQQPIIQPQQIIIEVDYDVIVDRLRDSIIEGIMRYNALWEMRNINKKAVGCRDDAEKFKLGHHGDTGLRRAAELMRCVTQATDLEEIDSYLVSCFKDNNIGNEKHKLRTIKSEPYSLFTLVNLSVLHILKSFKFDWQYDGDLKYIPLIHALYSCFSNWDIQAGPDKFIYCVEPVSSEYLDFVKKIDTKSKSPVQELIIKRKQIV